MDSAAMTEVKGDPEWIQGYKSFSTACTGTYIDWPKR
jgi:hypothetical protein